MVDFILDKVAFFKLYGPNFIIEIKCRRSLLIQCTQIGPRIIKFEFTLFEYDFKDVV